MRNGSHGFWFCIVAAVAVSVIAVPAASAGVVKYDTTLTLTKDGGVDYHGWVTSEVRKCLEGRRVILFKLRPGADRRLGARGTRLPGGSRGYWRVLADRDYGRRVRAKVRREEHHRYVCRADHAAFGLR